MIIFFTLNGTDESSTRSNIPSSSYFYQSSDGELVFLHSISFKPIFIQVINFFTQLNKVKIKSNQTNQI